MATAELRVPIDASADTVWGVLAGPDVEKIIVGLYAKKAEFENEGEDTILKTTLLDGSVIREQIELIDNDNRCLKYRVVDPGPLPYENYRGQLQVIPIGSGACEAFFQCRYEPVGMSEAESNQYWRDHNTEVMEKVKEYLGV